MEDSKKVWVPILSVMVAFLISQLGFMSFETTWSSFLPGAAILNVATFIFAAQAKKTKTEAEFQEAVSVGGVLALCGFLGNLIGLFFLKKLIFELEIIGIMALTWASFCLLATYFGTRFGYEEEPVIEKMALQPKEMFKLAKS